MKKIITIILFCVYSVTQLFSQKTIHGDLGYIPPSSPLPILQMNWDEDCIKSQVYCLSHKDDLTQNTVWNGDFVLLYLYSRICDETQLNNLIVAFQAEVPEGETYCTVGQKYTLGSTESIRIPHDLPAEDRLSFYENGVKMVGGIIRYINVGNLALQVRANSMIEGSIFRAVPITIKIMESRTSETPLPEKEENGNEVISHKKNYIKSKSYLTETGVNLESIQYFDGLGRLNQTVERGITPNGSDLVSLQEYDAFGRDSESWLPGVVASNNGAFVAPETVKERAKVANLNDANPFSKPIYEASLLNRVVEQYGPGANWHQDYSLAKGKAVRTAYKTNVAGDAKLNCILYKAGGTNQVPSLNKVGNYATGELYVTEIKDEDNNLSYEFKDKLEQVVLTRQINAGVNYDTYYVYNDFGNLCFVLPPRINDEGLAQAKLNELAYLYKYDSRNRCTWKKLPGCEPILYIYDKADQLIFSQDGEQKPKNEWTFTLNDAFGRNALTGTIVSTTIKYGMWDNTSAPIVKVNYNGGSVNMGYEILGYSFNPSKLLSVNYYDNYNFLKNNSIPIPNNANGQYTAKNGYGTAYGTHLDDTKSKGQLTATMTAQLPSGTMLYSAMYYDNRGRVVQTKSNNHLTGGFEEEYIAYNFTGQPTQKMHIHSATGKTTQTEFYAYIYDHAGRLTDTKHKLNAEAETLIAHNDYDDLGRLKANKKGGNANLNTAYIYNIRSWTTSMKSTHLNFNLDYTHGGNIKSQAWTQIGQTRKYDFVYDNLSRLTAANYTGIGSENYKTAYSYDKHGNMLTIQRGGQVSGATFNTVDNLALSYVGNQLNNVHDTGTKVNLMTSADFKDYSIDAAKTKKEYSYNQNGAMTQDLNKGITSIQYNSLNLPTLIDIKSPVGEARNEYTYSAGGQKLKVVQKWNPAFNTNPIIGSAVNVSSLTTSLTIDYVGNKIYENGTLKRILIDGGYIEGGKYHYYLTDHLGNNRAVAEANGTIIQRTQYYPFGMAFAESTGSEKQPYKYNGKELDTKHGLNMYDYSARYFDPAVPRFTSIDPLAELYYSISPYVYVGNNPLRRIDPTGMFYGDYYDMSATRIGTDGINDTKKYIVLDNSQANQVRATDRAGGTTNRTNVSSAVEKPSTHEMKAAEAAYDFTERTGHEAGYVAATDGTTSGVISQYNDGEVALASGYDQVESVKMNGKSIRKTSHDAHTHPKTIVRNADGTYTTSSPNPSGSPSDNAGRAGDFGYRKLKESTGANGANPSRVLGWRTENVTATGATQTRTVTFYNGTGLVGQVDWSRFTNVVNRIP